jgi:CheY-like chemotaxis protein/predicted regulator of Ras-like GTPase activity (Roadblock/LC7/MglB family)
MPGLGPKTVLLVDDEELFLRTIADGFSSMAGRITLLTAPNGRAAATILESCPVDLVVTDLKMPEMDGFELIAHLSRHCPEVPVIAMSAFGTAEIERRLDGDGISNFLDKPLDFPALAAKVFEALEASASGHLSGLSLPTFLQMIEADRKTCSVRVRSAGQTGALHFKRGELVDAEVGPLQGDEAALVVVCFDQPEIEILSGRVARPKRTRMTLREVLMEGFRLKDEGEKGPKQSRGARGAHKASGSSTAGAGPIVESIQKEAEDMAAQDKLKELTGIDGFGGAAVFTPTGESLAMLQGDSTHLKEVGVLANNVLLNAQKASLEMGAGRGQQVHVEGEKAHVLVRCLNEGTDPLKSQPGKAHIHMVVVLKNDSGLGLAKMRMNSVIEKLAEEFRM